MNSVDTNVSVKDKTLQLYDKLPQLRAVRRMECARWDESSNRWQIEVRRDMYPEIVAIRDEIINLNIKFFGYIASRKFVNNRYISYEDKFQAAVMCFCKCWWWYKWKGDYSHRGYRQDLAFSVFFKPRISEMLEREFDEVKYSVRRSLCIEVADQLVPKKHWTEVNLDDLSDKNVKLSPEKISALKAIFGSLYVDDMTEYEQYIPGRSEWKGKYDDALDVHYDSIEDLLVNCMVERESKLSDEDLLEISDRYSIGLIIAENRADLEGRFEDLTEDDFNMIGFYALKEALPAAESKLYADLKHSQSLKETFNN